MVASPREVAVVGAGVVGLSAAAALGLRGARVTTFDPEPPGSGQSFGPVRAFRVAHPTALGVDLAVRSLALWSDWEQQWQRPLIRRHGLLMADPESGLWAARMSAAGQPFRLPSRADAAELCPLVDADRLDPTELYFDPQAGAIDTRATIEWLLALNGDFGWRLVPEHVVAVRPSAGAGAATGALVVAGGSKYRFDAAVVAAGAGTEALAEGLGLHLDTAPQQRTWAALRPHAPLPATAMWMQMLPGHRYGWAQMGVDGAVALSGDWSSNDPSDTAAGSFDAALDYAADLMPKLDPATARRREMLVAPVVVPGGQPFAISTVGAVTLVEGNQLFKFAPLLGHVLADAVVGQLPPWVPAFAAVRPS
ncbi:MAG: FAD-dependent oxidoreductase [Candidatus Nanopelagicales bacterium]